MDSLMDPQTMYIAGNAAFAAVAIVIVTIALGWTGRSRPKWLR